MVWKSGFHGIDDDMTVKYKAQLFLRCKHASQEGHKRISFFCSRTRQ